MSARFHNKGERDLFDQFQAADKQIRKKTKILLPNIKKSLNLSYENVIFLAIGFVMLCIISFSLGVEKGRQDVDIAKNEQRTASDEINIARVEVIPEKPVKQVARKNEYTIQLAAFKKRDSAEEEKLALKKIGHDADIRQSGSYYQLYIGGFDSKKKAQRLLNSLKNKYADCYIKQN